MVPPLQARQDVQESWARFRAIILSDKADLSRAKDAFEDVCDSKWEGDLGDFPVLSLTMIGWAEDFGERGHRDIQEWLIISAEELSPLSAHVEFARGRYYLGGGDISPLKAASHYYAGFLKLNEDFKTASHLYARLCVVPLLFFLVFGLALAMTAVFRYAPLLLHDFSDIFPSDRLPAFLRLVLLLVVLLIPLAAGLYIWWVVAWALILFSLYMTNGERMLCYLWIAALLSTGFFIEKYGIMAGTRADRQLQAAIRARNSAPRPGDEQLLKKAMAQHPNSTLFSFLNARMTIKTGQIGSAAEAESLYKDSLEDERTMQEALNNLAEIYYAAGNPEAARETLIEAEKAGPSRPEIYFNLAQYYMAIEKETERNRYKDRVAALEEGALSRLSQRASHEFQLNRYFLPLKVPSELVWERAWKLTPEDAAIINATRERWMGPLPPGGLPFLATCLAAILLMVTTRIIRNRARLAKRCASCGNPMCMRCHLPSKDPLICSQCYSVFRTHTGVDMNAKKNKRYQVERYKDRWRRLTTLFSIFLPGTGQLIMGATASGVFLFLFASLIIAGFLSVLGVWPHPYGIYASGFSGTYTAMVLLYVIFALISISMLRSQLEHWR